MYNGRGPWQRVSPRRPCPICGRASWCMVAGPDDSPTAVICPRTPSDKRAGEAGSSTFCGMTAYSGDPGGGRSAESFA